MRICERCGQNVPLGHGKYLREMNMPDIRVFVHKRKAECKRTARPLTPKLDFDAPRGNVAQRMA